MFEWMAENAYIPPGMHRLLAAGGLAVGLWGGRSLMDIVVAHNHDDGSEMKRETVPQLFRPLHGIMTYNQYSDAASDRWKSVVDKFVPAVIGGMTAYYGGRHFFHGKGFVLLDKLEKPLHPFSAAAKKALADQKVGLSSAEQLGSLAQSDAMRRFAGGTYVAGATGGTDKAGGLMLGNHNAWAVSFAQGAGIRTLFPGESLPIVGNGIKYLNRTILHSMGASSVGVGRAMNKLGNWAAANIHLGNEGWLTEKALTDAVKDITQNFKLSEAEFDAVKTQLQQLLLKVEGEMKTSAHSKGSQPYFEELSAKITGGWGKAGLSDLGVMKLLDDAGVDLASADIANHGMLSIFSRGMNAGAHEAASRKAYAETLKRGTEEEIFKNIRSTFDTSAPKLTQKQSLALWGTVSGTVAGVLGIGSYAAARINKRAQLISDNDGQQHIVTSSYTPPKQESKPHTVLSFINGKPLDAMEWASRMVIVPPSMHRFMGAAYLSGSLYAGMKIADVLTGRKLPLLRNADLTKSMLKADEITGIWKLFKPLHNLLAYTPGSSAAGDRARLSFHYLFPVALGAYGNYLGSQHFFHDRAVKMEHPKGLEDYTDKIAMEQSKSFAALTAATSILNTGSGIHLVPVFNYSSNLQSRYIMGSGLQVATPGIGKWWSGNEGLSPWGTKKTLSYVARYLTFNPEKRPRELPALVHSVLAKLYPDMPEDELLVKKRAFLHAIHEVRDTYFPNEEHARPDLKKLQPRMQALLTGEGFEHLLLAAGFDPMKANLSSNGLSGSIANALGQKGDVARMTQQYRDSFAKRHEADKETPQEFLKKLANSPTTPPAPSANDNALTAAKPETKVQAASVAMSAQPLDAHAQAAIRGA